RRDTPYPCPPATLVSELVALAAQLPRFDRASVGFPGAIRRGRVIEVPSLSRASHDGPADPALAAQWAGFELAHHLQEAFGVPVRAGNDADLQGCAAVSGHGFELVLTLGTGVGTALFDEGRLLPHMELSHGPFRKGRTYDEVLGDAGRRSAGTTRWRRHVRAAIAAFDAMLLFDHCHIGGGNAKRLHPADLGPTTALVPNIAGILGGIALWQQDAVVHDPVPHAAAPAPTDRAQRVPQGSRR
ncbi:MAG: ROK family protein, partial [Pseudonocardia sp.]|nr:ROK family protein [Pseudonocardia sp.]